MKIWIVVIGALLTGVGLGVATTVAEFGVSPPVPRLAATTREGPRDPPQRAKPSIPSRAIVNARPEPPPASEPQPKVALDSAVHKFGLMDSLSSGEHTFVIRNTGRGTLQLKAGKPSCRCTVSRISKRTVPPGESTEVTLKWKTTSHTGVYRKTAPIYTNDRGRREIRLIIEGRVRATIAFRPSTITLHNTPPSEERKVEVRLFHYHRDDMKILGHTLNNSKTAEFFDVSYTPLAADKLGEPGAKCGYLVTVLAKKGMPLGPLRQSITFATNLETRRPVLLMLYGQVRPEIAVMAQSPTSRWRGKRNTIEFGSVERGKSVREELMLTSIGQHRRDVKYTIKEVVPPGLRVRLKKAIEVSRGAVIWTPLYVEVPADIEPVELPGEAKEKLGRIVIETTHPEVEQIEILIQLTVKP